MDFRDLRGIVVETEKALMGDIPPEGWTRADILARCRKQWPDATEDELDAIVDAALTDLVETPRILVQGGQ